RLLSIGGIRRPMSQSAAWELPPLILHPFNERVPPAALLENSKAALMLNGLIPNDGTEESALHHRLMTGRYTELRMLFFWARTGFAGSGNAWSGRYASRNSATRELRRKASRAC